MTIAHIRIEDIDTEDGNDVSTTVNYEMPEHADTSGPISAAAMYGYVIHYLFNTGKINDFVDEAMATLNAIQIQLDDKADNNG